MKNLLLIFLHFVGLSFLIAGLYAFSGIKLLFVEIGAIMLFIVWIICFIKVIRSENSYKVLWILFILSMGSISVPVYLFLENKNK